MEQTLLLNATYEPLKVVHWQKAITLWCQGKVEIIPVDTLSEVLEQALVGPKKSGLISKLAALVPKMTPDKPGPAAVPH